MIKKKLFLFLISFSILSCSVKDSYIFITNKNWPDGSVISLIKDNRLLSRTVLYGEHAQLKTDGPGTYVIRIANKDYITYFYELPKISEGDFSITLPEKIQRKRIGTWKISLKFDTEIPSVDYSEFLSKVPETFTTICPELIGNQYLKNLVLKSHEKGIELVAGYRLENKNIKSIPAIIDSAEIYGVDGINFDVTINDLHDEKLTEKLNDALKFLKERNITSEIFVDIEPADMEDQKYKIFEKYFKKEMKDEQPDLLCLGFKSTVFNSDDIMEALESITKIVPIKKILCEFRLSGEKYLILNNEKSYKTLNVGELKNIIEAEGTNGIIKIPDSSYRIGNAGFIYVYDDEESILEKIKTLKKDILYHSSGIRIVYKMNGVFPNTEKFSKIKEEIKSN